MVCSDDPTKRRARCKKNKGGHYFLAPGPPFCKTISDAIFVRGVTMFQSKAIAK